MSVRCVNVTESFKFELDAMPLTTMQMHMSAYIANTLTCIHIAPQFFLFTHFNSHLYKLTRRVRQPLVTLGLAQENHCAIDCLATNFTVINTNVDGNIVTCVKYDRMTTLCTSCLTRTT